MSCAAGVGLIDPAPLRLLRLSVAGVLSLDRELRCVSVRLVSGSLSGSSIAFLLLLHGVCRVGFSVCMLAH